MWGTWQCILSVQMLDLLTSSPPTTVTSHLHTTFSMDSATQASLFQCLTASCFCDISLTTCAPQVLLSESCVADTSPGPSDAPEPEHHMCPLGVPPWGELSRTRCRDSGCRLRSWH